MITLLHIFPQMGKRKEFENRSKFGEHMDQSWRPSFLSTL